MPNYPFRCPECDEEIDLIRKVEDHDNPAICPECGAQMKRIYTTFLNDYRPTHSRYVQFQEEV